MHTADEALWTLQGAPGSMDQSGAMAQLDDLHGLDPLCEVTRNLLELTKTMMKLEAQLAADPRVRALCALLRRHAVHSH